MDTLLKSNITEQAQVQDTALDTLAMSAFHPYDSQLPIALEADRRLVKCLFKAAVNGANKGKAAAENVYIAIPDYITQEAIQDNLGELIPYITGYLQEFENQKVRKEHLAGTRRLSDSSFNMSNLIAALEQSGTGSRLNKEQIDSWFDTVADSLAEAFAVQLSYDVDNLTEQQLTTLDATCSVFKAKFGALASPKTSYIPQEAEKLVKYLHIAGADTGLGARLLPRLEKMTQAAADSLLEAL